MIARREYEDLSRRRHVHLRGEFFEVTMAERGSFVARMQLRDLNDRFEVRLGDSTGSLVHVRVGRYGRNRRRATLVVFPHHVIAAATPFAALVGLPIARLRRGLRIEGPVLEVERTTSFSYGRHIRRL